MPNTNSSYQIPNGDDPTKPFTFINVANAIKLTPTNYLSWKMQVEAILIGHDLFKYVDGSLPSPLPTLTTNGVESPNPAFLFWTRQEKLLFGALVGTLSQSLIPLVSQARTTKDFWDLLAKTYALPSRGHIKQLKDQFNRITKGPRTITDFMQAIKACADQLAALGKKVEHEDLIDRVLLGLNDELYKSVIDAVNSRDMPISFEELHEKLINKELAIQQSRQDASMPATAFAATTRNHGVEHVGGNMFEDIPEGDAIFLKWICHNLNDEACIMILKNCYAALPKDEGKVIICEGLRPNPLECTTSNLAAITILQFDMAMMATTGGKERTANEFEALAIAAGFQGFQVVCSAYNAKIIELLKKN